MRGACRSSGRGGIRTRAAGDRTRAGRRGPAGPHAEGSAPPDACLNCGHAFVPTRLNSCPECGQDTNLKPPTLREFAQQFGGSDIAVEGALWRSLKPLPLRTGELTREYLEERRRRYVLPLRLYLTISVIVLLLLRTVAFVDEGKFEVAVNQAKPPSAVTVGFGFGEAGLRYSVFLQPPAGVAVPPPADADDARAEADGSISQALGGARVDEHRQRDVRAVAGFGVPAVTGLLESAAALDRAPGIRPACPCFRLRDAGPDADRLGVAQRGGTLAVPVYGLPAMRSVSGGR